MPNLSKLDSKLSFKFNDSKDSGNINFNSLSRDQIKDTDDSKLKELYSNYLTNKMSMDSNKIPEGNESINGSDNFNLIFDIEKEDPNLRISNITKMAEKFTSVENYGDYNTLLNFGFLGTSNTAIQEPQLQIDLPSKDISLNSLTHHTFNSNLSEANKVETDNSRLSNYISNNNSRSVITNKSDSFEFGKIKSEISIKSITDTDADYK